MSSSWLTGKTYSDGEPAVTYGYDGVAGVQNCPPVGAPADPVGNRTSTCDAAGTETWGYDPMNRVATVQRKTNGVTKTVSYTYYLDGTLKALTYPSGRVVNYQVGGAELPLGATDGGSGVNYASAATYGPQGSLATLTLGGDINLSESYNSRLQPSTIQAIAAGGTNLLDLAYDFGLGTADNGDVKVIANNRDATRTQYFDYDALNRIDLANTQASTGANAWGQAFGYDPWGNLTSVTVTQGSAPSLSVGVNANNQLAGAPYSYDAAGDLLTDAVNTYTWNAEGKMATVSSPQGLVTYTYDGNGQRVEKSSGKLYWYGSDGNVLAESDASGNITDEYIFFGGKRIARVDSSGKVDYYLSDSLGSSRVVTDSNGNLLDECDFLPFGDEQCVASSSGNTYKFTGKERDSESGNDYFGARYYENTIGRFLSPDPGPWILGNPQSFNAYNYSLDNPLRYADDGGETPKDRVNAALHFASENIPYIWGGKNPLCGLDCSGLVQNVFKADPDNSIAILDTVQSAAMQSADLQKYGEYSKDIHQAQPGDAIFFADGKGRIVHTGIVVDIKDGQIYFVHAPNHKEKVHKSWIYVKSGMFGKGERFAGVGRPIETTAIHSSDPNPAIQPNAGSNLWNWIEEDFFNSGPPIPTFLNPPSPLTGTVCAYDSFGNGGCSQ